MAGAARPKPAGTDQLSDADAAELIADFLREVGGRMAKGSRLRDLALRSSARWLMARER